MDLLNRSYRVAILFLLGLVLVTVSVTAVRGEDSLSDQQVADAVEDVIVADRVVPAAKVFISASAGIVTISGSVDNLLSKERAAQLAATVRGVRSVINQLLVTPLPRRDMEIETDVKGAIAVNPATPLRTIGVMVANAVVTLSGEVNSGRERELIDKLAKSVKGVKGVTNNIVVHPLRKRPDPDIRHDVVEGLKWDVLVDPALVSVEVKDSRVALSGRIRSAAEKMRAMSLAWVTGVEDVDASRLQVDPSLRGGSERRTEAVYTNDGEIRKAVHQALMFDPRTDSFKISVEVKNQTVTLRGTVKTVEAKRAAEQDARNTVGVARVNNRLKVNPGQDTKDAEVTEAVQRALATNPFVDATRIHVTVVGGIAYLTGKAHTTFESYQADYTASGVKGVLDVINRIDISDILASSFKPAGGNGRYALEPDEDRRGFMPGTALSQDNQIQQRISKAIAGNPLIDSAGVQVSVQGGIATFTGAVDSPQESNAVEKSAFEAGATGVVNKLRLK